MGLNKSTCVSEVILSEYAKLIADSAVAGRIDRAPAARDGHRYWTFTTRVFRKLCAGDMSPSAVLRENKMLLTAAQECAYCGVQGALQWEHIVPKARGGPETIDNLVLSCAACNLQKGALNPIDWYRRRDLHPKHIPRLAMGKLLKLVLEEHRRRGTLGAAEFPPGAGLRLSEVCRVFETPE
jgi:hypothetical protein